MANIPDQCPVDGCEQAWDTSSRTVRALCSGVRRIARILDPMSFEEPSIGENHGRGFERHTSGKVYCYGSGGHIVDLELNESDTKEHH